VNDASLAIFTRTIQILESYNFTKKLHNIVGCNGSMHTSDDDPFFLASQVRSGPSLYTYWNSLSRIIQH